MGTVKYTVKARDNNGHEFIKTFLHPMTQAQMTAVPPEAVSVLQKMIHQYEDEILSAAPFCCVVCGRAADALLHMPTAHTQDSDPVVFDIPLLQWLFGLRRRCYGKGKGGSREFRARLPEQSLCGKLYYI